MTIDRLGTFLVALIAAAVVLAAVAHLGHEARHMLDTITNALVRP